MIVPGVPVRAEADLVIQRSESSINQKLLLILSLVTGDSVCWALNENVQQSNTIMQRGNFIGNGYW